MEEKPQDPEKRPIFRLRRSWLAVLVGVLLGIWLFSTPPGLLGKSDALAYAVCHRIGSHSFYFGDRPFSLCARCSGQYLGFLWGFSLQAVMGKKKAGFPGRWQAVLLGVLVLFYVVDGFNSLLQFSPGLERWSLYQPQNTLRLFSGLGMGLVISGFYFPLLGQTVWRDYSLSKPLGGISQWAVFMGGAVLIGISIIIGNPLVTYYLILLSTGGLLMLLTMLYAVIWILISKKENSFQKVTDLGWWILAGLGTALLQIALVDFFRYLLTGTWSGYLEV